MTGWLLAAVLVTNVTWHDTTRQREIPARIYAPAELAGRAPVIVLSHGLGGSRAGYAFLGRYWAEQGYLSVHLQHAGSDEAVWRGQDDRQRRMRLAAMNRDNVRNRPLDVSFAITQLLGDRRVATNAVGVAGHSFGAHTTLLIIGQRVAGESFRDPRVQAAVAMSSPRPMRAEVFDEVRTPCLHLTGTKDDSPLFDTTAADRRFAFDHIEGARQWLITIPGATHMTFAGRGEAAHLKLICETTTAFWDVFLRGRAEARARLWRDDAAVEGK